MTTIVGVQGDGFAVIGCDSRITKDDGRIYILPKEMTKITRNEKYLIGASGDLRAINLLSNMKLPSPEDREGKALDQFVSREVVPVIQEDFEKYGYGKDGSHESEILLSVSGVIYEVSQNYDWNRDTTGVYGVGSGSAYAVGALHALYDRSMTLEESKLCIKDALKIAIKMDAGTGEPLHILSQHGLTA